MTKNVVLNAVQKTSKNGKPYTAYSITINGIEIPIQLDYQCRFILSQVLGK